jgi:alpha/beta superfamily hydrolase
MVWKRLLSQGFAVFSWDKPGIGKSTGNWLAQSMAERQKEVQSAITFVRNSDGYSGDKLGLLDFSQAGWVVPAVANNNSDVGFVVGVGFAIEWGATKLVSDPNGTKLSQSSMEYWRQKRS